MKRKFAIEYVTKKKKEKTKRKLAMAVNTENYAYFEISLILNKANLTQKTWHHWTFTGAKIVMARHLYLWEHCYKYLMVKIYLTKFKIC